jgi:hypothetical protein
MKMDMRMRIEEMEKLIINDMPKVDISLIIFSLSSQNHLKRYHLIELMSQAPELTPEPEFEPDSSDDEVEHEVESVSTDNELEPELERQFPNCPFYISCLGGDLKKLDKMFIKRKTVIIYDDRAEDDGYFDQAEVREEIRRSRRHRWHFLNYTIVKSERGGYITLRDMLEAMIDDPHYHQGIVRRNPHRFLESFGLLESRGDVFKHPCFICFWGS